MVGLPLGLIIFAWTAEKHTHWIAPLVGQALIAYGLMLAFNSTQVGPAQTMLTPGLLGRQLLPVFGRSHRGRHSCECTSSRG